MVQCKERKSAQSVRSQGAVQQAAPIVGQLDARLSPEQQVQEAANAGRQVLAPTPA